jgi:hypothetical protein
MKKAIVLLPVFLSFIVSAQLVATVQLKEDVPGICNKNEVYALFPSFKGQEKAVPTLNKEQLLAKLNSDVKFLQDNPKYRDKGMLFIMLNCKGKVVQCKMDIKTKSPELDRQIVDVFNAMGDWQPGKLNGKEVDSSELFSFKIKAGRFEWD